MPLGIQDHIRLKLKKRVVILDKTHLYFSEKLKSIYSVNYFWCFMWFSLFACESATQETKLNNEEISIIKCKRKKTYQNKFPLKCKKYQQLNILDILNGFIFLPLTSLLPKYLQNISLHTSALTGIWIVLV